MSCVEQLLISKCVHSIHIQMSKVKLYLYQLKCVVVNIIRAFDVHKTCPEQDV